VTKHLSDESLMDMVDRVAEPPARVHVESCVECRVKVEEAREALSLAREADVPEPAPFYWQSLRRQVASGLEKSPRRARHSLWVPPALAAAAVLAVVSFLPRTTPPEVPAPRTLPAWSALPPAEEDAGLEVLQGLGPVAGDTVAAVSCHDVAGCVASLSEEESRLLAEALEKEWGGMAL